MYLNVCRNVFKMQVISTSIKISGKKCIIECCVKYSWASLELEHSKGGNKITTKKNIQSTVFFFFLAGKWKHGVLLAHSSFCEGFSAELLPRYMIYCSEMHRNLGLDMSCNIE